MPSLQPPAANAAFARASVLPASFGTMHAGAGGEAESPFKRVYEIGAEQAEVLSAASVAVAEKVAVVPGATSTAIPGEASWAALPWRPARPCSRDLCRRARSTLPRRHRGSAECRSSP